MQKQPFTYLVVGTVDCTFCIAAKRILEQCKLAYDEETITMEQAKARGFQTVPQIWYGPNHVGGYTELRDRISKTHMIF